MGTQRGRNRAGLTGLVDLPGLGANVKFRTDIARWNARMAGETRERRGRGGGVYATIRWLFSNGTIGCSGEMQSNDWPAPSTWRGEQGTIRIQITEEKWVDYPIEIVVAEPYFDAIKGHDFPQVAFTAVLTGEPVYTGWAGTQPAAGTKTKLDQIQWLNSFKNLDPKGLQSTAQRFIDVWGDLDDTDTAEQSKLLAVIAASLPPVTIPHSMKLRGSVFTRDALDGGTITETWGLTDTQEDVENQGTFQKVDPDGLGSVAQVTLLDATPNAPAGLVSRGVTTREINDSHEAITLEAARRSTIDDHEMEGSERVNDPLDLESQAADTVVYDTLNGVLVTPPLPLPELQHVSTRTQEIDRIASKATFGFDILNSEQKQTFPRIKTTDDAQNIEDEAIRAQVWNTTGGAPATPTDVPTNNVKIVTFADVPLAPATATVPAKFVRVWLYGPRNSRDKLVLPDTETVDDPQDLASTAMRAALDGETIIDPPGYVYRTSKLIPITDGLAIDRTLTVKIYGLRDTKDDEEMPGTEVVNDPEAIDSGGKETIVYDTAGIEPADPTVTLPTDAKVVNTSTQEINQLRSRKIFELGMRTTLEEIQWLQSKDIPEVSNIGSKYVAAVVRANATVSAPAAPASDVTHTHTDLHRITDTKWVHLYHFGRFTDAEQIEADGTISENDPADLDDDYTVTKTNTTVTPPVTPPLPEANMVVVSLRSRQVGRAKWEHRFKFGWRSSQSKLEAARTKTATDPNDLETEQWTADVYPTASPPVDPSLPTGLKLDERLDEETANPALRIRIYKYAKNDSVDRATNPVTFTLTDPSGIESKQQKAAVDSTPSLDAGFVSRGVRVAPLTPDHDRHVIEGGLRTIAEDTTMPGTSVETDPEALESKAQETFVYNSADPEPTELDATITPPTDTKVIGELVQEINQTKSKKLIKWGVRTSEEEITWLKSRRQVEAGMLDIFALVVEIAASDTPDATGNNPDVTNLSLHHSESHRLTDTQWVHLHEFRPFTATEALQEAGTLLVEDPVTELIGDSHQRQVNSSTTAPTTPVPTLGGTVCVKRTMKRVGKLRYQWDWYFGYRSNAAKLEADRTKTITDPDGLADEHFTADVWTVSLGAPVDPSPPTGLKKVEHTDLTTENPAFTLRIYHWGRLGHADRLVFPRTTGRTDGIIEPATTEGSIVTIATTLAAQAATEHASRKGTLTYGGLEIVRLNSTKALLEVRTIPDVIFISDSIDTHWRDWPSAGSNVIVSEVQEVQAAAFYWAKIVPYRELSEEGIILIKRRIVAANHNAALTNTSLRGLVNDMSFLGHAIGTVLYAGRQVVGEYDEGNNHVYEVIDRCRYCSHGWLDDSEVSYGWNKATTDPGIGQQTASTFGWTILAATTGDISGLLA